ncbi:MAG: molybdopterin cofactor-binding domain-containing protein, partial [bacterium]
MDVFLDMPKERYDHFVALARNQNIQILRAWGAGLYETEEFYDACDRQGVMVYQEFPNGAKEAVDDSLRDFIPSMRNHPALVWYGGGNEHDLPYTPDIQLMGKYAYEMDGTRPFHRTDCWAGSIHSYEPHWCMGDLESELHMTAPFIGEFGNPSAPNIESVRRYLPADERTVWPPREGGSFTHHTMIFNTARDMERMSRFAVQFLPSTSMRNFITGTQLSQTIAARHTLERARSRWPECTGALHYKHNEVYPACSWAVVDYYGVPKLAYYFLQDTFAPLHAAVLFPGLHPAGAGVAWPVFLFDDGGRLSGRWTVTVRAFDADLKLVKQAEFKGRDGIRAPLKLGEFTLDGSQTVSVPLWVVCEVRQGSRLADRTFYWLNYKTAPGCLFDRPATRLSARIDGKAGDSRPGWSEETIDASALKAFDAEVSLTVAAIRLRRFEVGRSVLALSVRDGRLTACDAEVVQRGGAYGGYGLVTILYSGALLNGLYDIPAVKYDGYRVYANTPACGAMRGHGTVNIRFAFESLLDSMAAELGLDPIEVRRRNLLHAPTGTINGLKVMSYGLPECLDWVEAASGWKARKGKLGQVGNIG